MAGGAWLAYWEAPPVPERIVEPEGETVEYLAAELYAHEQVRGEHVERYHEGDHERGVPVDVIDDETEARQFADFALWTAWFSRSKAIAAILCALCVVVGSAEAVLFVRCRTQTRRRRSVRPGNRRITMPIRPRASAMATQHGRDGTIAGTPLTDTQSQLLSYLRDRVEGTTYLKSKYVAKELGLSSKEVGINMGILEERATGIEIEQWGRSSSTTWKVTDR